MMIKNIHVLSEELSEYAESFVKKSDLYTHAIVLDAELIPWEDNIGAWGGDWDGHVLMVLRDHSYTLDLRNINTHLEEIRCMHAYSVANLPISTSLSYPNGKRRAHMTHSERMDILSCLNKEQLNKYHAKVQFEIDQTIKELPATPMIERPYEIHLTGTDDTSFTKCFFNLDKANAALSKLRKTPTWDCLDSLGFVFTN